MNNVSLDFVVDSTLDSGIVNAPIKVQEHFMYHYMQRYIRDNYKRTINGFKNLYWGYIGPGKCRHTGQNVEILSFDNYNYSVEYKVGNITMGTCPSNLVIPE